MEDPNLKEAENMEKEAKYHIIHVADDHVSDEKRKILDEFTAEVTTLFADFKEWLKENSEPDKVAAYKERVRLETALLIQKVKISISEINDNDKVKSGKEAVKSASKQLGDKLSNGVQDVMNHEEVQKVVAKVSTKVQQFKEDDKVKETVKRVKRGTLHVATSAFDGLKKVLEEQPESPTPIIPSDADDENEN